MTFCMSCIISCWNDILQLVKSSVTIALLCEVSCSYMKSNIVPQDDSLNVTMHNEGQPKINGMTGTYNVTVVFFYDVFNNCPNNCFGFF